MQSIENKILNRIQRTHRGVILFPEQFSSLGSSEAVRTALHRLEKRKEIVRLAHGIYTRLEIDPLIGPVRPGTEAIAEAIRRRDKARVVPTGILALNALGLTTQVPMNVVYLTDGTARTITIGKRKIIFKTTTPRNLSAIGKISSLVIQALREIGLEQTSDKEIEIVLKHLAKEDPRCLEHDIRLAPEWIRVIMRKAQKPDGNTV
ncbi:MAG: DUF6088 family protein [Bacteroidia bacterium]|nr:DUF6088 family protein [Bacteroidia bacterium]